MKKKKVFLVPLNWGLGHATRMIPIIRKFIDKGDSVYIGGSPSQLIIFYEEFPEIQAIKIPYAKIRFNGNSNLLLSLILQSPLFIVQILMEHYALSKIIKKYKIDLVISDNCYGLWNKNIHSIFISHQINIILPEGLHRLKNIINRINLWFINKFDECWVPDMEHNGGYAGKLSHNISLKNKISYIGIQSRFQILTNTSKPQVRNSRKKILFLISGPENQRTVFEELIRNQIKSIPKRYECIVVRGLPEEKSDLLPGWYNHLPAKELLTAITEAELIVCRSGYSTIMDLLALKKTALLVPTPGQAEQEYLAEYLSSKKLFHTISQHKFKDTLTGYPHPVRVPPPCQGVWN